MVTLITNVYDEVLSDKRLKNGWGFSCYIEHNNEKILFDTGNDSYKLLFNLENIGINIDVIDCVVISHNHWDHIGGLTTVVRKNRKLNIYVGSSFSTKFKKELSDEEGKCITVDKILSIYNRSVWIGPEIGNPGLKEIALAIESSNGLIIVTGCAHPGIVNVIREFKRLVSEKIYLVLGGFHLYDQSPSKVKKVIKEFKALGVEKVAPCHCTGIEAVELFQQGFRNNFIEFWVGSKIKID